jgi:hypothetical protein
MLYGNQLSNIISNDILTSRMFLGCYASDEIPIFKNKTFAIINTDPANKVGSHWTVLYKGVGNDYEFFDPLGKPPTVYKFKKFPVFNKLYYNLKPIQNPFKNACGFYCLYYMFYKSRGHILADIFEKFSNFRSDWFIESKIPYLYS